MRRPGGSCAGAGPGAASAREGGFPAHLSLCTSDPDSICLRDYRPDEVLMREMARWCDERGVRFPLVCGASIDRWAQSGA